MPDNFNDTLDEIKKTLEAASQQDDDGYKVHAEAFYNRTAAMTAVFQTEVLLVIADALTRIADAMEAADGHDDDGEMSIAEAVRIAHDAKIYSR